MMDRQIPDEVRRKRVMRRVTVAVIAVAAVAFFVAATVDWLRPSVKRRDILTAKVTRGSVDATLQASGSIIPAVEQVVSSPVDSRVLRIVRRAGDRVKAGDELVTLDTSAARLDVEQLSDRIAQKESELAQLRLRLEESSATLKAQIEQQKLDAEMAALKASQNDTLYKQGLVAQQEQLASVTQKRKNEIGLRQLDEQLARGRRTGEAQLAAIESELRTLRNQRDQSQRQFELAMMRADRDGVITSIVQEAGTALHRGDVVARIADLSSFRVTATISDIYAARIAAGMRVKVRLDDATILGGTIRSIDPRIENGIARFYAELDQPAHPKLRNDVRVDVYVVTGRHDGVLRVNRGALNPSERDEVFVVRGRQLVRTPARFGLMGEDAIEIRDGLREGDEIVVSSMNDFEGIKAVKVR